MSVVEWVVRSAMVGGSGERTKRTRKIAVMWYSTSLERRLMAKFNLVDDGTLDTVLRCDGCEQESRYNAAHFDSSECEATKPGDVCLCFDRFIAWVKGDAEEQHECFGGQK